MKSINAKTGAFLAILALILIAFFANWFITLIPIGSKGIDLTEDRVHSISDGTESILGELDAPVVINYYATRKSTFLPKEVKLYMKKVDDFLKQYESLAKGKLRIEYLDPQPDTDAEDSANLDGISGQRINDENIYFGLSVRCLDKKSTIPFLSPDSETMLEYELSSAIAEVTQAKKPVIGLISALPVAGSGMPQFPGQPAQPQSWIIYEQLSQSYEMRDLGMTPEAINPSDIPVLLLIHPAGISKETEFKIDQYVLGGGTVIACLDGYSFVAANSQPQPNPMMPQQQPAGIPTGSSIPNLLKHWGISFQSAQTLADGKYRTNLQQGIAVALLSLTKEAFPIKDDIVTQGINDLFMPFPGAFTVEATEGIETTTMIQSSKEAAFVDGAKAARLDQDLAYQMRPTGEQYPLMIRVSGKFTTAFPSGDPANAETPAEKAANAESPEKAEETPTDNSLKEAAEAGTVFLLADSDMFFDQFSFRQQNVMGMRMVTPQGNNAALLQNLLDMSAGSKYLIGARSRAPSRRPFSVVQEMEADFEQQAGEKMQELQAEQSKVVTKIQELQAQKQEGSQLLLSSEQQKEIEDLRAQQVTFSKQLRDLQKDLKKQKDALSAKVTLANVAIMPSIVLLIGLFVYLKKRSSSRAK